VIHPLADLNVPFGGEWRSRFAAHHGQPARYLWDNRYPLQNPIASVLSLRRAALHASSIYAVLRNLLALKLGDCNGTVIQLDPCYFYHDHTKWLN
jgi:hypothetical protein